MLNPESPIAGRGGMEALPKIDFTVHPGDIDAVTP